MTTMMTTTMIMMIMAPDPIIDNKVYDYALLLVYICQCYYDVRDIVMNKMLAIDNGVDESDKKW